MTDRDVSEAARQVTGLYERHAADWIKDRGQDLFEKPWLDRFLALVPPAGRLLDLGCGSGEPIARYMVSQGYDMTGVDASPSLISHCQATFPDQAWLTADMRSLDLGATYDGIVAWHSFIHLTPDDNRRMVPILRRHSRPGTVIMFTCCREPGDMLGTYRGEALYHGGIDQDEFRRLLKTHDFDVLEHVREDPDCGHATIWLARRI